MKFTFSPDGVLLNNDAAKNIQKTAVQLDVLAYDGDDLGAVYTEKSTSFKLWSPTASQVKLRLYSKGDDKESNAELISEQSMSYTADNGIWQITVFGNLKNIYYTYLVTNNGIEKETVDIYACAVGVNGNRGMVADLSSTNPKKWDKETFSAVCRQTQAIVWEVHIKDFSNSPSSGISNEYRGKYLAFTQEGTKVPGTNQSTCLDYLVQQGINYVQLNPIFDFATVDEAGEANQFNWGYDPKNYNAPEGSYATDPYDGNVRIKELKQMIMSLHSKGIGVIMDVVYNHTMYCADSWFNLSVPNYYYRINGDGSWSNCSGCGNDTASEHKMFRKYMVDSVTYWAKEYHIDGFRFDLMGLHDTETMNAIRQSLDKLPNGEKIIMYGEAWNLGGNAGVPLATQDNMHLLSERIGAFNDNIRDSLRGNNFCAGQKGLLEGEGDAWSLRKGIKAACGEWAKQPSQTVTYQSCHDNLTLYDKLVAAVIGTKADYRTKYEGLVSMNKLGAAVVLTSMGISFMLAGEEMARSKGGDENSYKSPAEENEIKWEKLIAENELSQYYRGLIEIRKSFAPFMDDTRTSLNNIHFIENTNNKVCAYIIENKLTADTQWKTVVCIFNTDSNNEKVVDFSAEGISGEWIVVANENKAGIEPIRELSGCVASLPKSSALILVDKESFMRFYNEPKKPQEKPIPRHKKLIIKKACPLKKNKRLPILLGGAALAGAAAFLGGLFIGRNSKKGNDK